MEEQINSIEQLREYYPDGKFNWPEIIQNFKLTKKFMNDNIVNLDTILLFENQELDLEFVVQNIIYFNINDIDKYLNIKDPSMIVSLQAKKDEAINKLKQIEEKVETIKEKETEEVLDVISEIKSITTQSEQAELVRKEEPIVIEEPKIVEVIKVVEAPKSVEEPKIVEVTKVIETHKSVEEPTQREQAELVRKEEVFITNSLIKQEEIKVKKPQTLAIIEQLALTRLKEVNVDYTTVVGNYLLSSYIDKYNDLKMKYEFSISKFDFLILDSLDAKAH